MAKKNVSFSEWEERMPKVAPAEIGARLEAAREALGIETQKAFLAPVGMSQQHYSNMLAGTNVPTVYHLAAFSETYRLPMDFIVFGKLEELPYKIHDDVAARLNAANRKNTKKRRSA